MEAILNNNYPQLIPIEVSFDSLFNNTYYLEYGGKKRVLQNKGTYLIDYNDICASNSITISTPIKISNNYYEYDVDSGDIAGKYFLAFANPKDTLFKQNKDEKFSVELVINTEEEKTIYDVKEAKAISLYLKTSGEWDHVVTWNRYNSNGELVLSISDTLTKDTLVNLDLSILPLLWAAKYTISNSKGNLGAYYGFVDNAISLLALESDSLPASERSLWEKEGVPLLKPDEIKFKKSEVKAPPQNDVIVEIEIPVKVSNTIQDHTSICSIFLKDRRLLIQSSDLIMSGEIYNLYLIDLKGRVIFKKQGKILENGRIVLDMPSNIKGVYLVRVVLRNNRKLEKVLIFN